MYETRGESPGEDRECRPDYEKQAEEQAEKLRAVKSLKESLLSFLAIVRPYRKDRDGLASLLGTLEIDIMERQKELNRTLELAEKYKNKNE